MRFPRRVQISLQTRQQLGHLDSTCPTVFAHRGVQLSLPPLARLLVMPMLAQIGENARFFALLFEALERALKVLVVMDYDFRQNLLPPFLASNRRLWIDLQVSPL